jgi:hypothetical protein
LRSKKLLDITSRIRFDELDFPLKSEDLVICHYSTTRCAQPASVSRRPNWPRCSRSSPSAFTARR